MLSARNQLKGTVKAVNQGQIMAEVVMSVGDAEVVALISKDSATKMGLKAGDKATAVIKATEVMVMKD